MAIESRAGTLSAKEALQPNIDKALGGFVDQLFAQRRRTALPGPRGGAIVSDPATVDEILRAPEQFPKTFGLLQAVGQNRFSTNGAEWEWRRDLTQRHYLRAASSQSRDQVAEIYRRRLDACGADSPAAIGRAFLAASTEIFHYAFGCTVDVDSMLHFFDRARAMLKRLQYASLVPPNPADRRRLEEEAFELSQHYQSEIKKSPTLSDLMSQFDSQAADQKFQNFVAAEEFMMNFFAAVETSTATLSTAIDRLGLYRDGQERLAAEALTGGPYPMLECFINEILRFYPPVPYMVREVAADAEVEHLKLKTGGIIIISVIGMHHHPDYWRDPDHFDCARSEFIDNSYDRRAFIPFSAGIRSCGGARLARMELSEGLKAFIQRFSVNREGTNLSFDYVMAMRPKSWDPVKISRREPAVART